MFDFSSFKHEWSKSDFVYEVPTSKDYRFWVNGKEVPVYTCRISAYPFNTWWPGHQRPISQSEIVSYVNIVSDEAIEVEVEPLTKTAYERVMIKPYSKKVSFAQKGNRLVFTLKQNGGYVLELDNYHGLLYIFNNKPINCPDPENVAYYFGKGVHFPGKITLRSGDCVYVDKDALVYGCIFAENAENIRIYGNGILDDSCEERIAEPCYEPYANGNLKFYDCKNIRVEGVGLVNSAIWCVNLFHCFDVELDGINVFGQWRYNTDGIDIVNSKNITLKNAFVHSFDDTVTIKGIDRYSFESNTDILIENCVLWCDWGKTMEIGLETECQEYRNIVFRGCDLLRAGNAACDIQNGDRATVHDVTFENISVELEGFYTKPLLQRQEEQVYDQKDTLEIASLLSISNKRFRDTYAFCITSEGDQNELGKPHYAGVHDITVKNVNIYCDEKILSEYGSKCVQINVTNVIPTTEYHGISVEDVLLNGVKLSKDDITVNLKNCSEKILSIK